MKLNFGKKLVLFLHWLLSLAICALFVCLLLKPDWFKLVTDFIDSLLVGYGDIASFVLLGVYALLAVLSVIFIFSGRKNRGDRGFITVDSSEAGRTRISIGAVDQMIRQAVRSVEGIADMKSGIINNDDAISINVAVTIVSGAHVPTVTMNIQRSVRSYIELNCGVAVREVSVSVNALENNQDGGKGRRRNNAPAPAAPVIVPVAETPAPVQEVAPVQEEIKLTLETPAVEVSEQDISSEEYAETEEDTQASE